MQVDYYTDTREDTIDAEEFQLYEMIMAYRATLGLPEIPLSQALTITASRHVLDTVYNLGGYDGHTWSDAPYDGNDSATYPNMSNAPERIGTGYTGLGFEISTGYVGNALTVPDMTAEIALDGWQGSAPHNDVITQEGVWQDNWQAIGVAIHESTAHVWFGYAIDASGLPTFDSGVGPAPDEITGGDANDLLMGNSGAETFFGGPGDDVIMAGNTLSDRGAGATARFTGSASEYEIEGGLDYATATTSDGTRDKIFGVEFLVFEDTMITLTEGSALDGAGAPDDFVTAERVALLYEAALNRNGAIDLPGLNFYIDVTERDGLSDEFLAQDLMTSPEFTQNFGNANTLSNADFLERIYLNVLDRASDVAGRQFYLDLLDAGTITKALALADIAVSPENTLGSADALMRLYESTPGDWAFL